MLSSTRSSANPATQATSTEYSGPWIYFVTLRDLCDHLVIYRDGSFNFAASGGRGTWRLHQPAGGGGLLLELKLPGDVMRTFVCQDGNTQSFVAGPSQIRCVQGPVLPLCEGLSPRPRRHLVFSSIGEQCLPVIRDTWLSNPAAVQFDVALVFYKDVASNTYRELQSLAEKFNFIQLHAHKDLKWPNFKRWIIMKGGFAALAAKYDCVWVADDDVRLSTDGINQLFNIVEEYSDIQIASPSYDSNSVGVWRYFDGHVPKCKLRYTDFVECTAPVIKTSMFLDPIFCRALKASRTGCFLDFAFHATCGGTRDAIAIIDAVQCNHPERNAESPSEMNEILEWGKHKQDDKYFEQENLPKDWWWYRNPRVFASLLTSGELVQTPVDEEAHVERAAGPAPAPPSAPVPSPNLTTPLARRPAGQAATLQGTASPNNHLTGKHADGKAYHVVMQQLKAEARDGAAVPRKEQRQPSASAASSVKTGGGYTPPSAAVPGAEAVLNDMKTRDKAVPPLTSISGSGKSRPLFSQSMRSEQSEAKTKDAVPETPIVATAGKDTSNLGHLSGKAANGFAFEQVMTHLKATSARKVDTPVVDVKTPSNETEYVEALAKLGQPKTGIQPSIEVSEADREKDLYLEAIRKLRG